MAEWIPIATDSGFIAADVIRWKEGVYKPRRSKRGKPFRLGDRCLTAEVLQGPDRNGWVRLLVRQCETLLVLTTRQLPVYLNGTEIKRACKTIMRGNPERLLWSDESARVVVATERPVASVPSTDADGSTATKAGPRSRSNKPRSTRPARKPPVPER